MSLTRGDQLGPYEIVGLLGSGGMGEVYRARDARLNRDVALKILPQAFTLDPDRLARFRREAQLLAALNHSNIGAIYGLEEGKGGLALVLELVEGPTLAEAIAERVAETSRGFGLDEALAIAKQIAEALEAAHEQGIVHRDLKPGNIKLRPDGAVKVLDFGLAKAFEPAGISGDLSVSPTITSPAMTRQGFIIGTATYMSPEQARGKAVDKRADVWAFGVVLYELVTGRRPFKGDDVSETLAAVIKDEPRWGDVPQRLRPLIESCLEKDPKRRLRDIGDMWRLIRSPAAVESPAQRGSKLGWIVAGAAALGLAALAPFAFAHFRESARPAAETVRFEIAPSDKLTFAPSGGFALSPDGRKLAFTAAGTDGVMRIFIRAFDAIEARPLPGTESPGLQYMVWSPDSRFLAFNTPGKLKKIDISGGPAQTVCDVPGQLAGGTWNHDGVILFGLNGVGSAIMRVSASGGVPAPVTALDTSRQEILHLLPSFLSDGRHFLYLRISNVPDKSGLFVGTLDAKPDQQSPAILMATSFEATYVAGVSAQTGQLLFRREGALMVQPFDDRTFKLTGEPIAVAEQLGSFLSTGFFSASTNGALVYKTGGSSQDTQLAWLDRRGMIVARIGDPSTHADVALSPDGRRAAVSRFNLQAATSDVWLVDTTSGASTRLTFGPLFAGSSIWSPDSSRVLYFSVTSGVPNLYEKLANGAKDEEVLLNSSEPKAPTSWSRNGRFVLYSVQDPKTKYDVWTLALDGSRKAERLFGTPFNEDQGRFSPDGRWVAYRSDESGRAEIYVQGFSPSGQSGKMLVSRGGGSAPRWRADGKELFYVAPDRTLMAVDVTTGAAFQSGSPTPLFKVPFNSIFDVLWDVAPDGQRFLVGIPVQQNTQSPFTVVLNWQAALKK